MEERIKNLYDYLNSRHSYYADFIRYEQLLGNTKNADILDARASEIYFIMNELLRAMHHEKTN
jgi:hypothetical protein